MAQNTEQGGALAPIGILDSGVGGLSVLAEVRRHLPNHPLLYVGDSAWCPYGGRPAEQIRERVFALTDFLLGEGAGLVVVACNSATIAAVEALRASYPVAFVGMEPGVKPAAALTESGVIGVLATEASLAGEKFHRLLDAHADGVRVITRPCPRFVELVEAGSLEGAEVEAVIDEVTAPLLAEGADVLVLGCTHYPFLKNSIARVVGPKVKIVDTGAAVAQQVMAVLGRGENATVVEADGGVRLFTSGEVAVMKAVLPVLMPELVGVQVERLGG